MRRAALAALALIALGASARPATAQAWAPRAGQGGVTFITQMIDHVGRIDGDNRVACCGTTNVAVGVDVDYGFNDRWSVSATLPYVFAKYRGGPPKGRSAFLPYAAVDSCHCVNSAIQDVAVSSRYNLLRVRRSFSLMTSATVGIPTSNYDYAGEAVVGFGLRELTLAADAGQQLRFLSRPLTVEGHYGYTIVERVLDISHNRSNALIQAGYDFPKRLGGHVILSWQRTHGGLRFPIDVEPYPERYTEFHRLLQDNYFQAGGGVSYEWGGWEWSMWFLRAVSGTNTHDVHVYTVTVGRPFRIPR
jgi:hypothetical protein